MEIKLDMDPKTEVKYDVDPTWRLLLNSEDIDYFVQKCANHLNDTFKSIVDDGHEVVIAYILKGATYFHVDLKRKLKFNSSDYGVIASSYHNSQTQQENIQIESKIEPSKFKNKFVILIDELFDNGTTMMNVKNAISELAEVPKNNIYTCTLFKKDKKTNVLGPDFFGVSIPNIWGVGYGLDHNGFKREWKCLYAIPKVEGVEKTSDDIIFENSNKYKLVLFNLQMQK
jgi:hypoxanthine phosphoribosyltransferase